MVIFTGCSLLRPPLAEVGALRDLSQIPTPEEAAHRRALETLNPISE